MARRREHPDTIFARRLATARSSDGDTGDGGIMIIDQDGHLLHDTPADVAASLRTLVARLQSRDKAGIPALLGLTSALPGEGVTFVSRALAAIIAHDLNRSVCLVDLNWWDQGEDDANQSRDGLAALAFGHLSVDDALVPTADPLLSLVPAGYASASERPLLATMPGLVGEALVALGERFDHVLLDLPAVLTSGEALSLANQCEHCLLVIRQGVTSELYVDEAVSQLSTVNVLGVVLNQVGTAIPRRLLRLVAPW